MTTFSVAQEYTTPGTYMLNITSGVTGALVTMTGGGGGGCGMWQNAPGFGFPGGGAGEFCIRRPFVVPSGGSVTVIVGAKGVGGTGQVGEASAGSDGALSSFNGIAVNGGLGGHAFLSAGPTLNYLGGTGGGTLGGHGAPTVKVSGITSGMTGLYEFDSYTGGPQGGSGRNPLDGLGFYGYPAASINFVQTTGDPDPVNGRSGGHGAPSPWGLGGVAQAIHLNGTAAAASSYGAGGGGSTGTGLGLDTINGGDGAGGYVLVQWIN